MGVHTLAVGAVMAHTRTACQLPYFRHEAVKAALRR